MRGLLDSSAQGDRGSISDLYDLFERETWSICAHYISLHEERELAMTELWQHLWQTASRLASVKAPVSTVVIFVAHAHAHSFARRQPMELRAS